jgi:hypothetical protein
MPDFITPPYPPMQVARPALIELCSKVAALWPDPLLCERKKYGIGDVYSCGSVTEAAAAVSNEIEDWPNKTELEEAFCFIVADFVGAAIKHSSRYAKRVSPALLDFDAIVSDIAAREDIEVVG